MMNAIVALIPGRAWNTSLKLVAPVLFYSQIVKLIVSLLILYIMLVHIHSHCLATVQFGR